MKPMDSGDLGVLESVLADLDEIAERYQANITGVLYSSGTSFKLEYDEQNGRHLISPAKL